MISLDPSSPVAPFEQIRGQIADLVRAGTLAAGQRLPAIRQLAADLRVAPGTIAKAYSALEADGMLETSRTTGTRVRDNQAHSGGAQHAADAFVREISALGLTLDDALSAVRTAWAPEVATGDAAIAQRFNALHTEIARGKRAASLQKRKIS